MSLFAFKDYRSFLKAYLEHLPKKGHGELAKMAKALGVHATLMSLILAGERELTLEQAFDLARYLEFTALETDYFSLLVQLARAGNHRYKSFILEKIEAIRKTASQLSNRFEHEKVLTDQERLRFYSSWIFSAVRLSTSTSPKGRTLEELQQRFHLPRPRLVSVLEFLVSSGLVVQEKDRYKLGTQRTFLEHGSPHLLKHHANWRIKALQQADELSESELMFTSPVSIAKEDFAQVREQIAELLKQFSQTVKDSPADDVACLNIDFFWIKD